jgi:hypothetical protein
MNSVIDALGYSYSDMLYYPDSDYAKDNRSLQVLFKELAPSAIYLADNKPFAVFIELRNKKVTKDLYKKVWNAQIPLLILSFDDRVEIYNGCSIDSNQELILLEQIDSEDINENSPFSFWNISSSTFWKTYEKKLSAPKLDTVLLDNIRDATHRLRKKRCAPFAVKIILRLIFIRYLIDRGVDLDYRGLSGNLKAAKDHLLTIMQNKSELYDLFAHLKDQFNGNLFELYEEDNLSEIDLLDFESLKTLHDLAAGTLVLSSGQTSLFPLYDFKFIPVELISNIYERFLGDEEQQKNKAFYTPPYLVNYLLEQTITPFLVENTSCKILDPACGSGIFLVESARKLIERNIIQYPSGFDDKKLVDIITENLWGIDKNPEAIDVAIFSIYLTVLDYKDPRTLKGFDLPLLKGTNFFICDFFSDDVEEYLHQKNFDFIIGNPPWGNIEGLHVKYCERRKLRNYRKEISRCFVYRTKDFASSNTCCCLIVTSKLFYNIKSPSVWFRKWLLRETKVNRYIELGAVRELIFTSARGPAGVVIYRFNNNYDENKENEISHLTLKPNIFFKLFNIIVIEKNDYKFVPQALLLENDWAWKILVFGYTHDFHLIKNLYNQYPSIKQIINKYALKFGSGIQTHEGDKQDASHLAGQWLINANKGIKPFQVNKEFGEKFPENKKIHRAKKHQQYLFNNPHTLIKKGFDTQSFKFRAVYSEDDFLYTDAITGICGNKDDKKVLLALTGLLNSSYFSYLNLMLGSSSGIEREQGFATEIFKYPAIVDTEIAELVEQIEHTLDNEHKIFHDSTDGNILIQKLDKLILEKLGLSNDVFVDYVLNIHIPMVAKNKLLWNRVNNEQLHKYARVFIDYFSMIMPREGKYIAGNIYKNIQRHYCAIEFVFHDTPQEKTIIEYDTKNNNQINLVSKFMLNKVNDLFYQIKDIVYFTDNSFYVLKTDENKNWHPAMAKLDLSDVIDKILTIDEEPKA